MLKYLETKRFDFWKEKKRRETKEKVVYDSVCVIECGHIRNVCILKKNVSIA